MKKMLLTLVLVLIAIPAFALTAGKVPVATSTSSPGTPSSTTDSDLTNIKGVSAAFGVPLTITGALTATTLNAGGIYCNGTNCGIGTSSPIVNFQVHTGTNENLMVQGTNPIGIAGYNDAGSSFIKLNLDGNPLVINSVSNADVYTNALADYSGSSTIVGFSVVSSKLVQTKRVGKSVWVNYVLTGTSNANTISFTVPYQSASTGATYNTIGFTLTNGTYATGVSLIPNSSYVVTVYPTAAQGNWTNGTSNIAGQFTYQSA